MTTLAQQSPAVLRWRERFAADPVAALDVLLTGRVALGPFDRASPADALAALVKPEEIPLVDGALTDWLAAHLGQPKPDKLIPKIFAKALVEAFRAVVRLPLPQTGAWCGAHHGALRIWLRGFCLDPSRDPESALLIALAYNQKDRSLLGLWRGLLNKGRSLEHARAALLGLRKMPADDQGKPESGLPKALLRGLLDWGTALARHGEKEKKTWLAEVDFLAAVYPMSKETWADKFREVLQARTPPKAVCNWLDRRYPAAFTEAKGKGVKVFVAPPDKTERDTLLQRLSTDLPGTRPLLAAFLDRHRFYTQQSGDSFYLVQTFCNVGNQLLKIKADPAWARDLAHEAARWEPSNHHTWSLLARALEAEGDWRRAAAVYWHARRRFPHNDQSHAQLGHALILHGQAGLGELVYHEALRLFPDNAVCAADYAHALRVSGRLEEAVAAYRQAQERFHRNPVLANGLADTLLDLQRLPEAEDALVWAEQVVSSGDERSQRTNQQIRQRLRRAQAGEAAQPRTLHAPHEGPGGDINALTDITGLDIADAPLLGRAGLWRHQANGHLAQARAELETLPESSIKLVELGLWHATAQGWQAAAEYFDADWERYAGDGVLRVHRQRAHRRAGENVDWSWERLQYPELTAVILTEEQGRAPGLDFAPDDDDLSEEQRQDAWYKGLIDAGDAALTDLAEEGYLASRQLT